jgi:hypothetical protein
VDVKTNAFSVFVLTAAAAALVGCAMTDPTVERGPKGTIACVVQVDSSQPGVSIETNHVFVGKTPLTFKVFGNADGTFHNDGSAEFVITAIPQSTNQVVQNRTFKTGKAPSQGSKVPGLLFFDMDQPSSTTTLELLPP